MTCPACRAPNEDTAESCFKCGKGLYTLTEGALVAGRYEILSQLGRGGMGTVYRARDRVLDEIVAFKVLRAGIAGSPEAARRFRTEIKLARRVTHPNVCRIHDYGEDGHILFISMELVEGTDLKSLLRSRGRLGVDDGYDVALQVSRGLQAIHDVGVIHRDLKTPNIMQDTRGAVRLMDFGIAKRLEPDGSTATATGLVVGTPEYMSPEQARGEKVDFRSDVYALGVVLFEIFTGEIPFRGETPIATILKHLHEPPPLDGPRAALLPPPLVPVLGRMLAKEPAGRYPAADDVIAALRDALRQSRPAQAPTIVPDATQAEGRTGWGAAAVLRADPQPIASVAAPTPVPTPVPTAVPTPVPTRARAALVAAEAVRPPAEARERPPSRRLATARPSAPPRPRGKAWIAAPLGLVALTTVTMVGWMHLGRRPAAFPSAAPQPVPAAVTGQGTVSADVPRASSADPNIVAPPPPAAPPLVGPSRPRAPERQPLPAGGSVVVPSPRIDDVAESSPPAPAPPSAASRPLLALRPIPEATDRPVAVPLVREPRAEPPAAQPPMEGLPSHTLETLVQGLGESRNDLRRLAMDGLVRKGEGAVPALLEALRHPDARVREGALLVLREARLTARVPDRTLDDLARDPDPAVQTVAAGLVTQRRGTAAPARPHGGSGQLRLIVRPWAQVALDGVVVGNTPMRTLTLPAGVHTLRLAREGYKPWEGQITIRPDEISRLEIALEPR